MGHVYVERGSDVGVDVAIAVELGGGTREGVAGSSRMTSGGSTFGDATIGSSESESSMGTETLDDVAMDWSTGAGLEGAVEDSSPVGSAGTTSGGISHVEIWVGMVPWLVSACCASD